MILCVLCFMLSLVIFESFLVGMINKYWVDPVMKVLYNSDSKSNLVISVGIISSIIYYSLMFKYLRHFSVLRIISVASLVFIYIIVFFSDNWQYSGIFDGIDIPWIHLFWLYFIAESILFFYCRYLNKKLNVAPILEREDTHKTNDSYNRNNVVESTYETLKDCFYENGSFVVGIKGMWGSGKTTFIKQLENKFNNNKNKEFHIINFQPWRTDGANSITKLFFKELEDNLKFYIPSISNDIKKYLKYILPLKEDYLGKLLGNVSDAVLYDTNPYERIQTLLRNSKLPLIVFIDDVDRLSAEEILEVLKLVRNTADFPFVQFVICYDSDYVVKALKNNGIENASKYQEKFFNVEIDLPSYEDRVVVKELWDRLEHIFETTWPEEKDEIRDDLIRYDVMFKTLLPTVRDVIRFSNSFILVSSFYKRVQKHNVIIGYNLFLIELLRYRYPVIYNTLKDKPSELLKKESKKYSLIDNYEEKIKSYKENEAYTADEFNYIKILLSIFYDKAEYGISKVHSFPNYFMYREDEKYLKLYEIMELTTLNDEELSIRIEELYPQKYKNEFKDQFNQLLFKTIIYSEDEENDIKNMINIDLYYLMERLVKLEKDDLSIDIIATFNQFSVFPQKTTINNIKSLVNFIIAIPDKFINERTYLKIIHDLVYRDHIKKFVYNYEDSDIKAQSHEILLNLLKADTHRSIKAKVIKDIIESNKNPFDEDNLTIDENILLDILKQYFIECKYKVSEEGFSLFNSCFTACKKAKDKYYSNSVSDNIKQIMLKEFEEHPNDALSYFISYTNDNVLYVNDTFINLFDGDDKIEEFILSHSDCDVYKRVDNFWEIYKHNEYRDINLDRKLDIEEEINNDLEKQSQQLDVLLEIYNNFENYEITDEFKNKVHLFPLKIKLREKVKSLINAKLPSDENKSK